LTSLMLPNGNVGSTKNEKKRVKGFEPSTSTLATWCSTTELHPRGNAAGCSNANLQHPRGELQTPTHCGPHEIICGPRSTASPAREGKNLPDVLSKMPPPHLQRKSPTLTLRGQQFTP